MTTTIAPHIADLLKACDALLKQDGTDKRAVRRTRSHLESAYYAAQAIVPPNGPERPTDGPQSAQAAGINVGRPVAMPALGTNIACICAPGTRNRSCTAH